MIIVSTLFKAKSFQNKLFQFSIFFASLLFITSLVYFFIFSSALCEASVNVTHPESIKVGQKCLEELNQAAQKLNKMKLEIAALPLILQQSAIYQDQLELCRMAFIDAQFNYVHWLVKSDLYGWVDISKIDAVNYKEYLKDCIIIKDINTLDFSQVCERFKYIINIDDKTIKLHKIAYDYVIHHKSPGFFYSANNMYNCFYQGQIIKLELQQIIYFFNTNPGMLKACIAAA